MKLKNIILVALFAALTAIGALIRIPLPSLVPFTLQFFFCALAGALLGSKSGALSQIIYIALGLAGLPIFANGNGGMTYLYMPSFGFLLGLIFSAFIIGFIIERQKNLNIINVFVTLLIGLLVLYLVGLPYMFFIINSFGKGISLIDTLVKGCVIFLITDLLKVLIAALLVIKIRPIIKKYF